MYLKPHQVMLVAAHNGDLAGGAEMRPVDRLRGCAPTSNGPGQKRDLKPEGDWDAVGEFDHRGREEDRLVSFCLLS